jgi:hypothetical protein
VKEKAMYLLLSLFIPMLFFYCTDTCSQYLPLESYTRYPIEQNGSGENGVSQADLTMQSGTPLRLSISLDKQSIWAEKSIGQFLLERPDSPDFIKLSLVDDGSYRYQLGEVGDAGTIIIRLLIEDHYVQGYESINYVLGDESIQFRLATADSPDPRNLSDIERCSDDSAQIRLEIGATVSDLLYLPTIDVYEHIATESSITVPRTTIEIIAGPICMDSNVWWQVRLDDEAQSIAWMPETINKTQYALRPINLPSDIDTRCSSERPSRLSQDAYMTPLTDKVMLYQSLDQIDDPIASLNLGDVYQITSDMQCRDGTVWWYVENEAQRGWVREIFDDIYDINPSPQVPLTPYLERLISQG